MQKLPKIGLPIILLVIVLLIFASKSSINIGYGEAGVLFKTFGGGVVTDEPTLGEGFHIIAPWNRVYVYNVKQQEFFEGNMQVLSSNGLEISLDVSVLYQPKYNELGLLHQTKGENYVNIVLIPQIRDRERSSHALLHTASSEASQYRATPLPSEAIDLESCGSDYRPLATCDRNCLYVHVRPGSLHRAELRAEEKSAPTGRIDKAGQSQWRASPPKESYSTPL